MGRVESFARVSNGEGDKLHLSLVFLEGRDDGEYFFGLIHDLVVATEVFAEADLYEDKDKLCLVERGRVWGGGVRDPLHK